MTTKTATRTARKAAAPQHSARTGLVITEPETVMIAGAEVLAGTDPNEVMEAVEAVMTPTKAEKATAKEAAAAKARVAKVVAAAPKAKTSRQLTEEKLAPLGAFVIANHYSRQTWTVKDAEGKGWLFNRETLALVEDTKEARTAVLNEGK